MYRPDTVMPTAQTLGKLCENSLAEVGRGMGRLDAARPIDRHRVKGAIESRHMSVRLIEARSGHLVENSAGSGNEAHVWLTKLDDLRVAPEPRSTLRLTEGAIVLRSSLLRCSNGDLLRHLIAHVPEEIRRVCKNRDLASRVRLSPSGRSEVKVQSAVLAVSAHRLGWGPRGGNRRSPITATRRFSDSSGRPLEPLQLLHRLQHFGPPMTRQATDDALGWRAEYKRP